MDYAYRGEPPYNSEMTTDISYSHEECRNTKQYACNGTSCWSQLNMEWEHVYDGVATRILTPAERNVQYVWGPNDDYPASLSWNVGLMLTVSDCTVASGGTIVATCYNGLGERVAGQDVTLETARNIYQGKTADGMGGSDEYKGEIRVLGASPGDNVCAGDFQRVAIGEEAWEYGCATVHSDVDIVLHIVEGDYPLLYAVDLSTGMPEYRLYGPHPFSANPKGEVYPDDGASVTYTLQPTGNGYSVTIAGAMGTTGTCKLLAVDDGGKEFFVYTDYVYADSLALSAGGALTGPRGRCEVHLDPANSELEKAAIMSSRYPPIRDGLASNAARVGSIFAISVYPPGPFLGQNVLSIRYAASDLPEGRGACSLQIFRFDEATFAWDMVGGGVDEAHNAVSAAIHEPGIYGVFSILAGDFDGDGIDDACDAPQIVAWSSVRTQGSAEYAITLDPTDGHAVSEARRASTNVAHSGILKVVVDFDQPVQPSDGALDPTDVSVHDQNGVSFLPDGVTLGSGDTQLVITFNVGKLFNLRRYTFDLAGKFQNVAGVPLGGDTTCDIRALVADVDSSGVVNSTDVQAVKARIGHPVDESTAPYDVNASGTITTTDQALAKSRLGNSAP